MFEVSLFHAVSDNQVKEFNGIYCKFILHLFFQNEKHGTNDMDNVYSFYNEKMLVEALA